MVIILLEKDYDLYKKFLYKKKEGTIKIEIIRIN